jgi:hypothetical protein
MACNLSLVYCQLPDSSSMGNTNKMLEPFKVMDQTEPHANYLIFRFSSSSSLPILPFLLFLQAGLSYVN